VNNDIGDKFVDETAQKYYKARVITAGKNIGFSKGNNLGIQHVSGDIVIFLNQDTEVSPTWLAETVSMFNLDEKIGIVGSKIFNSNRKTLQHAGGHIYGNALTTHVGYNEEDKGNFDEILEMEYVTGASLAITRVALKCVKGFDPLYFPGYFEDSDLCLAAKVNGFKVIYAPNSVLYHYESTSLSKFSERFFYYFHRSRLRFVIKSYTFSDFFKKFLPVEYVWIRDFVGPDQVNPLREAYSNLFRTLPYVLWHRLKSRKKYSPFIKFGHPEVSTNNLKLKGFRLMIRTLYLLWTHPRRPGIVKTANKSES